MIYLLKSIFCMGILFLFYRFFLEKEKIFLFNRVYLLFSAIFSLLVPFVDIATNSTTVPVLNTMDSYRFVLESSVSSYSINSVSEGNSTSNWFLVLYCIITLLFFLRFSKNFIGLWLSIKRNEQVALDDACLVLVDKEIVPYSFMNYVFINKGDFNRGEIDKNIMCHELAHVNQRHSVDIFILEFLRVFVWFNPIIHTLISSVRLNHEFLADDYVVSRSNEPRNYQYLLLRKINRDEKLLLSSPFNYLITRKRLIMMKKQTALSVAFGKQVAAMLLVILVAYVFATKVSAQENTVVDTVRKVTGSNSKGVSEELIQEYDQIVKKYISENKGRRDYPNFNKVDMMRLQEIYLSMSEAQQAKQVVAFMKTPTVKAKTPTPSQLESWKDAKEFGVWIDGERINNSLLNNYKNTDFSYFSVSRILKNAKNYGKHNYQVDLMTEDYFKKGRDEMKKYNGYAICYRKL